MSARKGLILVVIGVVIAAIGYEFFAPNIAATGFTPSSTFAIVGLLAVILGSLVSIWGLVVIIRALRNWAGS